MMNLSDRPIMQHFHTLVAECEEGERCHLESIKVLFCNVSLKMCYWGCKRCVLSDDHDLYKILRDKDDELERQVNNIH